MFFVRIYGLRCVWLLLIACLLSAGAAQAQSRKELEERRKRILKELQTTNSLLKKTSKNKAAAYDRLVTLQKQIEQRERLIRNIESEIQVAEEAIARSAAVVAALEEDVTRMREEYGRMVRSAFRRKTVGNPLLYFFSAQNLNAAFRRWMFLRKYDNMRRSQAQAIAVTQAMLQRKMNNLARAIQEKESLRAAMQGQKQTLDRERTDKNELVKELSQNEAHLRKEIAEKQAAHDALNKAIEAIIREEIREREEAQALLAGTAPKPGEAAPVALSSESLKAMEKVSAAAAASQGFQKMRGKLAWPVEDGFISRKFGRQKHPTIPSIEITNNGVDIRVKENADVFAVFEGRVAGVTYIPGSQYTVIIQHGDFYTVYANLEDVSVRKGDAVKNRQRIGRVGANPITSTTEVHFEVWRQKEHMNPSLWLK